MGRILIPLLHLVPELLALEVVPIDPERLGKAIEFVAHAPVHDLLEKRWVDLVLVLGAVDQLKDGGGGQDFPGGGVVLPVVWLIALLDDAVVD